jgi:hypothetical protein
MVWSKADVFKKNSPVQPLGFKDNTLFYDHFDNYIVCYGGVAQTGIVWVILSQCFIIDSPRNYNCI